MKITIVQFSPSGSTSKVTAMLSRELETRGQSVQLVNIAGDELFFVKKNIGEFLHRNIKEHDVLLVGGPVYAHHLQYHVQDLLKALPSPGGKWGRYAVPYVCYGGISSGIALKEAAGLLKRSGRTVFAGMKVSSPHSMTRAFMDAEFNKDKLQNDSLPEVTELVDRIVSINPQTGTKCNARQMHYNGAITALKAKIIFREKLWHQKRYPQISISGERCTACGKCVQKCPVLHLRKENKRIFENHDSPCVHCFNCINQCPSGAINLVGDMEKGKAFMSGMIARQGGRELPATAVYPLR